MPNALFEKMKWRLIDESGQGADLVTAVLSDELTHSGDVEIETDVVAAIEGEISHEHIEYQWTEQDFKLFLGLYLRGEDKQDLEHVEVNLADRWAQEAIHIVAAARFAPAYHVRPMLDNKDILTVHTNEYDITDLVALNTKYGFRLGVIVAIDSVQANVVMLDPWQEHDDLAIGMHERVIVDRFDLLPAEFAHVLPADDIVIH